MISSPAWFSSRCDPQQRRSLISSFVASSSPGPHAFLLLVAVNQPADDETRALDVLEALLGPSAVRSHTVVLFTHTEELDEDEQLEQYLLTWRKDLGALVKRCGDRYHTLETRGGDAKERKAVEELLQKVEQAVAESGEQHFSSPLYQEAEERVRERQEEMLRASSPESSPQEEEMEAVRDQAERSVGELDVDVESFFPPAGAPPAAPSLLCGLWEKLSGWLKWLPTVVRREALLGALVGLFVGGPYGGVMGATVGSVATEVKRRRSQKVK